MVKCYGYNSVKHGMDFAQDLKLGQYMVCFYLSYYFGRLTVNLQKIPPRVLFVGQIYSSILATMTQVGGEYQSLTHLLLRRKSVNNHVTSAPVDDWSYFETV